MTIDEAIKDLTDMKKVFRSLLPPHEQKSLDLAIEAFKFRLRWEQQEGETNFPLLPGETEE